MSLQSPFTKSFSLYGELALIQQGKAQLQVGHADQALTTGEQAIKLDAKNWEGYALAGGALMNLKRYDEAITRFGDAMERAPQDKQAGLSELRKQCLAETQEEAAQEQKLISVPIPGRVNVNWPKVTVDVGVILTKTQQFIPGLKVTNFRIYEDGVGQTVVDFKCVEAKDGAYQLAYVPTNARQDGSYRRIRVELVDGRGRPLRMQDEKHRPLTYEIFAGDGYFAKEEVR